MTKALKPSFKHVIWNTDYCFNAKIDNGENLSNAWHYHPEIELILVKRSEGTRIVGNSVETFRHNDLVLIGKNLPHAFLHEEKYLKDKNLAPEAMVIQFYEDFLGNEFFGLPELREIQDLFLKAKQGLCVTDKGKAELIPLFEKIFQVSSLDRILLLLQIFKLLTNEDSHRVLINDDLIYQTKTGDKRINKILEYTYANYDEQVRIEDVAKIANLTKESFCRYFKIHTNKTYMEFLTEYRINKACRMIKEDQASIKEIGYSCGFDSLSNFYYQFKKIMKLSPLEFKCSRSDMHL